MPKKELTRNKKPNALFNEGDEVICLDYAGLRPDVTTWLELKEVHKVKKVFSGSTEPILILEDIEGHESPKLDGRDYPFLSERFVKNGDRPSII